MVVWGKVHPLLAFVLVSAAAAFGLGMPAAEVAAAIRKGMGDILGALTIVIIAGAMLGKLVAESGAAQRIASALVASCGHARMAWAMAATGLVVGIPAGFSTTPGVLVSGVQGGQAAAASGLRPGDRILAADGVNLGGGQSAVAALVDRVKSAPDQTLQLQTERAGKTLTIALTPADMSGIGRIGAQLQPIGTEAFRHAKGPGEAIRQANRDFATLTQRTVEGFITLATHFGETASQVSGPVKIVEMGASLAKQGGSSLFLYTALISINLAVLNALPLPLLDGGQFVLLMIEGLRGKPLPERFQMAFMQSGFVFLVGLSLVLIVKDTSQLAAVQQLLNR